SCIGGRGRLAASLDGSGVSREAPAPFWERPEAKSLRPTHHSFETAKNDLGLGHNETRSWHGWHRHVSLVMLAFAMMAAIRRQANNTPPPKTSRRTTTPKGVKASPPLIRRSTSRRA